MNMTQGSIQFAVLANAGFRMASIGISVYIFNRFPHFFHEGSPITSLMISLFGLPWAFLAYVVVWTTLGATLLHFEFKAGSKEMRNLTLAVLGLLVISTFDFGNDLVVLMAASHL